MKLKGIFGKGSGKLGSSVWGVSGGVQVVREYNPEVTNPQTEAQTAQRAKFKLLTQLAAAMSGQIAFRKSGLTSARNFFVSYNSKNTEFIDQEANVNLKNISLTGGSIELGSVTATRGENNVINVSLSDGAPANVSRVVYVAYKQTENDKLIFIEEKVVSEAGQGRTFATTINADESGLVVYAYGIIETSVKATVALSDYQASIEDRNAVVMVLRTLSTTDYQLTATAAEIVDAA